MIRGLLLSFSVVLAMAVGCGKTKKSARDSGTEAGQAGMGGTLAGGSARGGAAGVGRGGSGDGGEPTDGGAPSGGQSGASSGGSSGGGNGGASTGGVGGANLPEGCEGNPLVSNDSCNADMICDGRRLNVSCAFSLGLWSCRCTEGQSTVDFDFPVATGVSACEAAMKACADPDILSDEMCERTRTMGVLGCAIHDRCETLHDVDGVTLRTRRTLDASCDECKTSDSFCCSCADASVIDYRLRDVNPEAGCDFMEQLCKTTSIVPVGEKTCEPVREDSYPDQYCEISSQCAQPVELGDGTRLSLYEGFSVYCASTEEGSRCTCSDEDRENELVVDVGMPPVDVAICRSVTALCAKTEALEPAAPRECIPNTDIVLPDGCTLYVDCVQSGTLAGAPVTVLTKVGAQCNLEPDGSFSCYCNNRTSGPYELEADDAKSACVEALDVCPTRAPTL